MAENHVIVAEYRDIPLLGKHSDRRRYIVWKDNSERDVLNSEHGVLTFNNDREAKEFVDDFFDVPNPLRKLVAYSDAYQFLYGKLPVNKPPIYFFNEQSGMFEIANYAQDGQHRHGGLNSG